MNGISLPVALAGAVVLLLAGGALGYVLCYAQQQRRGGGRTAAELRRELDAYEGRVQAHFEETAELVGGLTEHYRAVYRHLARGAQDLCRRETGEALTTVAPELLAHEAGPGAAAHRRHGAPAPGPDAGAETAPGFTREPDAGEDVDPGFTLEPDAAPGAAVERDDPQGRDDRDEQRDRPEPDGPQPPPQSAAPGPAAPAGTGDAVASEDPTVPADAPPGPSTRS